MESQFNNKNNTINIKNKYNKFYYNCIVIIKAAAFGMWFYVINRILHRYYPAPTWIQIGIMFLISTFILMYEDGFLSELHDLKPRTIAAITNSTILKPSRMKDFDHNQIQSQSSNTMDIKHNNIKII